MVIYINPFVLGKKRGVKMLPQKQTENIKINVVNSYNKTN